MKSFIRISLAEDSGNGDPIWNVFNYKHKDIAFAECPICEKTIEPEGGELWLPTECPECGTELLGYKIQD